ncbi:MAG: ABC transporter permease [Gracilibacteraceae bacterium]|jgi:peptide/nickel transport system permease protein|nr:ABC transporter permease [Gracilibacteraceae bacterium]
MKRYLFHRLLQIIPVVFGITVLVFFIMRLIPGDPALVLLGTDATPEDLARMRETLGLDQSLWTQFAAYARNALTLDFGNSIFQKDAVTAILLKSFPATLELSVCAMIISLLIAVPLGIAAAVKQNTWIDFAGMAFAQLGTSMPVFWIGVLLIMLFSVQLGWLPSFGRGEPLWHGLWLFITTGSAQTLIASLQKLILPAFSLGVMGAALISRMIRSTMLEVLDSDYIRTARSKGTPERKVIMKHAFRNALLPVVTTVGLQFGALLGNAIVTETVFAWPGIGRVIVTAISQRDFPLVQGGVILIALAFALINLCVDLLYAVINPKIRH